MTFRPVPAGEILFHRGYDFMRQLMRSVVRAGNTFTEVASDLTPKIGKVHDVSTYFYFWFVPTPD
jgi:hypothetical protein